MPGARSASLQNERMYRALRRRGYDKTAAARISNARTPGHTVKAPNYGARAGQVISGALVRGGDGKFSSGGGGEAAAPNPRKDRANARQQARAGEGQAEAATRAKEDAALDAAKPGKERAKLRAQIAAARRNRANARRQARADEAAAEAQTRAGEDAAPKADKPAKEPKKGGGGGGSAKPAKPSDDEKRSAADKKKQETALATAQAVGLKPTDVEQLQALGTQNVSGIADRRLLDLGLLVDEGAAGFGLSDQGRRALAALERGDTRGYQAALQDARGRLTRERTRADRAAALDAKRQARDAERQRTSGREAPTEGAARRNPRTGQRYVRQPGRAKSFAVFKDHQGRDRWLAITTTAYQDQDNEYISREALKGAVRWGDRGQDRGTLRYWHVPGFDLGTCDFQATTADDRLLIESGIFNSDAAAGLGRRMAAKGWQMSPGFLHPADEPRAGVYDHILLFERSVCPPGKASNPYTQFLTKELPMDDAKLQQLKELTADNPTLLDALLATATKTNAAATEAGAVYKDAPAWAQALITRLDAVETALKAAPPMPVDEMAEVVEEMPAEVGDELAEPEMAMEADDGPLLGQADADLIAQAVVAAMGPALDLEKKMRSYLDEMKGMLGTGKAAQDTAIAAVDARVKTLEGETPIASGYRASQDAGTALPAAMVEALKAHPHTVTTNGTPATTGNPVADFLSGFNLPGGR